MNDTSVYWTAFRGMEALLMKMPLGGGVAITLATDEYFVFNDVALDATSVYWTTGAGTVLRAPLDGGIPTTLAGETLDGGPGPAMAQAIAVSAASVFWTTDASDLLVTPLSGGSSTTLASGVRSFALGGESVYWTTSANQLLAMPVGGGTPVTLASGVGAFAVDAASAYWTSSVVTCPSDGGGCDGRVLKMPLAGGPPTMLASGQNTPVSIAIDATSVYWMNLGLAPANYFVGGSLMKVPLAGGLPSTLLSQAQATGALVEAAFGGELVVDATSVYFTGAAADDISLLKLTPK